MKPKEWLKANGHIKEVGRGRMSVAHIALINEAVANGVEIEGYSRPKATAQSAPKDKPAPKESTGIADVPDALRDARDFKVVSAETGKEIPMVGPVTVCNGCRSSLTYCPCPAPRVWLDHEREIVVKFKNNSGT